MIGLADCNNFFVSCERAINPFAQKAGRWLCSATMTAVRWPAATKAKRLGVKMGQPAFRVKNSYRKRATNRTFRQSSALPRDQPEGSMRFSDISPLRHRLPCGRSISRHERHSDSALPDIGAEIVRECREKEGIPVCGASPAQRRCAR